MAIASLCQHFIQSIILALLIGFYPINIRAADEQIVITTLPKEFSDSWIVKSVRVNVQQGRHRNIEFNDTALIGRRFNSVKKKFLITHRVHHSALILKPGNWSEDSINF